MIEIIEFKNESGIIPAVNCLANKSINTIVHMRLFLRPAFQIKLANSDAPTNKGAINRLRSNDNPDKSDALAKSLGFGEQIGKGSYGKVYGGQYNGVDAVLKIEPPLMKTTKEIENSLKLIALRRKAPAEIQRNLPKIFIAKPIEYMGAVYKIIIMERLEAISESIKDIFRSGDANNVYWHARSDQDKQEIDFYADTKIMEETFKNVAYLDKLVGILIGYKDPVSNSNIEQVDSSVGLEELKKNLGGIVSVVGEEMVDLARRGKLEFTIKMMEMKFTELLKIAVQHSVSPEALAIFNTYSDDHWGELFKRVMTAQKVPLYSPEDHLDGAMIPLDIKTHEGRLVRALTWLFKNGLAWSDLHEDNALYRPSSDDIVVIDFGLYRNMF